MILGKKQNVLWAKKKMITIDEGTEGKLKIKQKLTSHNSFPAWDICGFPQVLLAALKLRKGK